MVRHEAGKQHCRMFLIFAAFLKILPDNPGIVYARSY